MAMELRHLRYFVVLAEELHFGKAAERLHITQPPLSLNIRQLEEDLGARLLVRDSRSVDLTPFGAAFLPEALRVLAQADAAHGTGRALAAGKQGKLHLGFTSSMLFRGMPEIMTSFRAAHPRLEIQLRDMSTEEQYQSLERRVIDASFSTGPFVPAALEGIPMAPDRFVCCVPEGHWATRQASVKLAMLAQESFVVFIREYLPGGYGRLLTMCMRAGFRPREAAYVRQWTTAAMLVSFGESIAIVPAALQRANIERVRYVPLEDEDVQTSGNFIWNPVSMSPALHALVATVRTHLQGAPAVAGRRAACDVSAAGSSGRARCPPPGGPAAPPKRAPRPPGARLAPRRP